MDTFCDNIHVIPIQFLYDYFENKIVQIINHFNKKNPKKRKKISEKTEVSSAP